MFMTRATDATSYDNAMEILTFTPSTVTTTEWNPPAPPEAIHDKLVSDSQFVLEHAEYEIRPNIDIE